jgi:hypothetical protein
MSRKQLPVKYDFFRIAIYFCLSLILYFLSIQLHIESRATELIVNNGLIVVFMAVIYFMEKPQFKRIKLETEKLVGKK